MNGKDYPTVKLDEVIASGFDASGKLKERWIVPRGFDSVEDFLKTVDDVSIKDYGYDSVDEFTEVVESVNTHLNGAPKNNIINKGLAGGTHVKGVDYDLMGFLIFKGDDVKFTLKLDGNLHIARDPKQFKICTQHLKQSIETEQISRELFTSKQLQQIMDEAPYIDDLTWHHHQVTGKMQLVDSNKHSVNHLGGNKLWGGGIR